MAKFNAEVKSISSNGTYKVYIRCYHNGKNKYIPTDMFVHERNVKNKEIKDATVNGRCAMIIMEYTQKLNTVKESSKWTAEEVVEFLTKGNESISFNDYCELFLKKMSKESPENTLIGYKSAINSFRNYVGRKMNFEDITKKIIEGWIKSLLHTKRSKENYPKALKHIFAEGCKEYNDYDRGIIRIKNDPFCGVKIPKHDLPEEKALVENPTENSPLNPIESGQSVRLKLTPKSD